MKFFWKIFFSTMLIAVAFFSIGTYYLIFSSFQYALDREISTAYKENEMIMYSLNSEIQGVFERNIVEKESETFFVEQWVKQNVGLITLNTNKETLPVRVSNIDNKTLYQFKWDKTDNKLVDKLPSKSRGYEVVLVDGNYFVHTAAPFNIQNVTIFIESYRNVTVLFDTRAEQHRNCITLTIIMLVIGTGVVLLVSSWLTKPIQQLSKASKQFAAGDFSKRVKIHSQDEIGELAKDYNIMAEQLEVLVQELKSAADRQELFVSSFAHELKTPLTSIIGYADMLRSKIMEPEQILLSANYIYEEGRRLETLSMKLMELIILKNDTLIFKKVNAVSFLNSVAQIVQPILEREKITFLVSSEQAQIYIDPDLLKTVCLNLIDNARKSINESGIIKLSGKLEPSGYSITVSDNGCGVEEAELSRITEAFYTVDKSRARSQGGVGLGLSICSEIIQLHEAKLDFVSQFGEGTSARIVLKGVEHSCQN
jgi:signal transduction histidine kinase